MPQETYTVFLLKDVITSFDLALNHDKPTRPYPIKDNFGTTGVLHLGTQNQSTPEWIKKLNPFLQTEISTAFSASISAVLLLKSGNHIFAFTFGHGRSLLASSSWVRDFGLKVTLNRVDPDKLRSVDCKTYEELVLSSRKQTSQSSGIEGFQLDIARDLVRAVTGDARDQTHFKRLTGADSLTFGTSIPFEDIGDVLEELLTAYHEKTYQQRFEWVDNIREVEAAISTKLDSALIEEIHHGTNGGMYLAPSEIVDWNTIKGFSFSGNHDGEYALELELDHYFKTLGPRLSTLTVEQLKRHKVNTRETEDGAPRPRWAVYDCLVWETELDGQKYVLFDGRWFSIAGAYAAKVQDVIGKLHRHVVSLPTGSVGASEGDYNKSAAAFAPTTYALLDQQLVRPDGAASQIEFCDLFSTGRHIIHVKKRASSASFSHLFSQASVSADAFVGDEVVRDQVRGRLKSLGYAEHVTFVPQSRPNPPDYHIVFAVLAKDQAVWPPPLPFFSAVNLMHHATRLQTLGFQVSLQHVKLISRTSVKRQAAA